MSSAQQTMVDVQVTEDKPTGDAAGTNNGCPDAPKMKPVPYSGALPTHFDLDSLKRKRINGDSK